MLYYQVWIILILTLSRGGYGKFAWASADLTFCIKKKFSHPRFCWLSIFFSYKTFVKKSVQVVENCSQGYTFVKQGCKFSNMLVQ